MAKQLFSLFLSFSLMSSLQATEETGLDCVHELQMLGAQFAGPQLPSQDYQALSDVDKRDHARALAEKLAVEWGVPRTRFVASSDLAYLILRNDPQTGFTHYEVWDINFGTHPFRVRHRDGQPYLPALFALGEGEERELPDRVELASRLINDLQPLYSNTGTSVDGRKFEALGISPEAEGHIKAQLDDSKWEELSLKKVLDGHYLQSNVLYGGTIEIFDAVTGVRILRVERVRTPGQTAVLLRAQPHGEPSQPVPLDAEIYWDQSREELRAATPEEQALKTQVLSILSSLERSLKLQAFRIEEDPSEDDLPRLLFAKTSDQMQIHDEWRFWDSQTGELRFVLRSAGRAGSKIEEVRLRDGKEHRAPANNQDQMRLESLIHSSLSSEPVFPPDPWNEDF